MSPSKIVLYGNSLGTGPTVNLATDILFPVAGIVLQAPFLSCARCLMKWQETPYFDYFPNIDFIDEVKWPTLILHGRNDRIVNLSHSDLLCEKLKNKEKLKEFLIVEKVGHNNLFSLEKDKIYKSIRNFVFDVCTVDFEFVSEDKSGIIDVNDVNVEIDDKGKESSMRVGEMSELNKLA